VVDIRKYRRPDGVIPFDRWMAGLKDERAEARILVQLDRLRIGLPGDWKSLGAGLYELGIHEGKGYRVYFGREGEAIVLLLSGGDKSTQRRDIDLARAYWRAYRRRQ